MSFALNPVPPPRGADCPPSPVLEAVAAGEQPPSMDKHLEGCTACAEYVTTLREQSEAFMKARPPELFLRQVQRRQAQRRPASPFRVSWVLASIASVALVAVIAPRWLEDSRAHGGTVAFKGSLVSVHLKRGTETRPLRHDEVLKAHDALRFTVRSEKTGFAAVLEKDAAGNVSVIAPFDSAQPQRVEAGSTTLDDSAVLDTAGGEETFVAIFSETPFNLQPIADSLRTSDGEWNLACDGCQVQWLRFKKQP